MRPPVRRSAHGAGMPAARDVLLSCRLDREWAALRRRPDVLRAVARWSVTAGACEDLALVQDLMRAESTSIVAAGRHVTPRTVRNHRKRAVHSIRRLTGVDPALDARPAA